MSEPILAATDLSDNSRASLRTAARLAKRRGVPLTVLNCLEWAADLPSWHGAVSEETRAEYRERGSDELRAYFEETVPGPDQPRRVEFDIAIEFPEIAIVDAIEEGDYGLAVIGATGLGRVASLFLGSVPEDVVRRSPEPVLVVPHDAGAEPYEQIVAPVDFSPCSRESLRRAVDLAREHDAGLTIVHAVPVMADIQATPVPSSVQSGSMEEFRDHRRDQFKELLAEAPLDGIEWDDVQRIGSPHDVVTDVVDERQADLVVMGTHGRRGFERLFLGSTATKILRAMPCAIMTVRTRD